MESTEATARYAVLCNAEQVGYAELAASHGEDLAESLRVASTACTMERLDGQKDAEPHKWSSRTECTIADHGTDDEVPLTPCTYNISIAVAHDIAEERGLASYGELHRLLDEQTEYDQPEAEAALSQWVGEVRALPDPTEAEADWANTFVEVFSLPPDQTEKGSA